MDICIDVLAQQINAIGEAQVLMLHSPQTVSQQNDVIVMQVVQVADGVIPLSQNQEQHQVQCVLMGLIMIVTG
ncbi:MAG: hypothetical protein DWQ05_22920 [Calditrichaeota bacterium]|nr:MAG: hypothetical protein DWQ05_22920 [Calditrichota bacterium]